MHSSLLLVLASCTLQGAFAHPPPWPYNLGCTICQQIFWKDYTPVTRWCAEYCPTAKKPTTVTVTASPTATRTVRTTPPVLTTTTTASSFSTTTTRPILSTTTTTSASAFSSATTSSTPSPATTTAANGFSTTTATTSTQASPPTSAGTSASSAVFTSTVASATSTLTSTSVSVEPTSTTTIAEVPTTTEATSATSVSEAASSTTTTTTTAVDTSPTNFAVKNPGFEDFYFNYVTKDFKPTDWTLVDNTVEVRTDYPHNGSRYLSILSVSNPGQGYGGSPAGVYQVTSGTSQIATLEFYYGLRYVDLGAVCTLTTWFDGVNVDERTIASGSTSGYFDVVYEKASIPGLTLGENKVLQFDWLCRGNNVGGVLALDDVILG